jgi:hypothetical protein
MADETKQEETKQEETKQEGTKQEEAKQETTQTETKEAGNGDAQKGNEKSVSQTASKEGDSSAYNREREQERKGTNDRIAALEKELEEQKSALAKSAQEAQAFKNLKYLSDLGVVEVHKGDVLALIRGNGEEVSETTIKKYVDAHPEWKSKGERRGVEAIGSHGTDGNLKDSEEEEIKKKFFGM